MDVTVFGAGIAGLTSAIALRARGHNCTVYERSRLAQDAGMGFILVPEGIACLERFGVHFSGAFSGRLLEKYLCRDSSGRIVLEHALPEGTRGIRRRELTSALMRALGGDEVVVFGPELEDLRFGDDSCVVSARMRSDAGTLEIEADLFVAAEGVNSRARQVLFPDWPTTADRVPEIVGLVRCDKAIEWAGHNLNKFHAGEGGIALGLLPVDQEHVVWYLQFDAQRFPMSRAMIGGSNRECAAARKAFVEKLVGKWAHPIPSVLASTDFARVHLWRPIDTDLIPRFHSGNLVLVGDAAHPLSPFTSQGVSCAVADAVVLARELDGMKSGPELKEALERYSSERREQCSPYVAQGRDLTESFLAPLSIENAVLPIALAMTSE
jgi:2-polyprenyl-6-methoxyphenol hydroxylase-like FAD-dependent oxidoreductase